MTNLKPKSEIKKGWDNNWLTINDMETSQEKEMFEMLMDRNEMNEFCDTLVSVDSRSIRQDFMQSALSKGLEKMKRV